MLRIVGLEDFQKFTRDLQKVEPDEISALHIAAGIGVQELVAILVGRCGKEAPWWKAANEMTAVSFRRCFSGSGKTMMPTASHRCSQQSLRSGRDSHSSRLRS